MNENKPSVAEKVQTLHLEDANPEQVEKVANWYKNEMGIPAKSIMPYDFVLWTEKRPLLFTRQYLEEHDLEKIKYDIDRVTGKE